MKSKIGLNQAKVRKAKKLAGEIAGPVQDYISRHTTVSVERTALRLLGADGVDPRKVPVPNLVVDQCFEDVSDGISRRYINALVKLGKTPSEINADIGKGLDISRLELTDFGRIKKKAAELIKNLDEKIEAQKKNRAEKIKASKTEYPLIYVIVATGNIYEDAKQARAAAYEGADAVAVIRTTAQSLLDYVPYGPTTEGFGGTYATQENFRIMRRALDEASDKLGRYIRLVNYSSGLCMPEIAGMGALERLDMMLNDSMYGILFRDINMYRTFTDQFFSRMIGTVGEIMINTGEDNYLTTADAVEKAHTVLASQLINERFALNAAMPPELMGLGHAFEIDPSKKNGFLYEWAQALMVREIFPRHSLKYMPPTKFMTGNIFKGYAMNTMFNVVANATFQTIQLLGMLTEAIHTPYVQDRALAIENALYVRNNIVSLGDEIEIKKNGLMAKRAREVLDNTIKLLEEVKETGLFNAIERGVFADIKRPKSGGKGFEGVFEKSENYWNPVEDYLRKKTGLTPPGKFKRGSAKK